MNIPNFTPRAQLVLNAARSVADRFHHCYIGAEHILLAMLKTGKGVAVTVMENMGVNIQELIHSIESSIIVGSSSGSDGTLPYTPRVKRILSTAATEAKELNHNYVGTEHILLSMLKDDNGWVRDALFNAGLNYEDAKENIIREVGTQPPPSIMTDRNANSNSGNHYGPDDDEDANSFLRKQRSRDRDPGTPALDAFGRDLTARAAAGELDPVIGRRAEIERVIQILCRRT
ncbi:MAG: ATP-dependent Clp protease ATP-binding subunit, partial [Akkermansia sp.]|nr:ATP-dependent Clp protease ATP-binding subunit [Akkermansia sp.]